MSPEQFEKYLASMPLEIQRVIDSDITMKVANEAVGMFKQNFQDEGFFGQKWQEVDRRKVGTKTYKAVEKKHPADTERKILTGRTSNLGRSIKSTVSGGTVTITSDLEYSSAHNDGTLNAGRGHSTRIPQRQFIGSHPKLDAAIDKIITEEIGKIINI
jgi:phage gpG-like protein